MMSWVLYIYRRHFEPYTRTDPPAPRCLIVDGHSSHISWKAVKYALDHDIDMICLPSVHSPPAAPRRRLLWGPTDHI